MDIMVDRNVIAIIPARGGSKRIPQKNIYPLHGKPLLSYTIQSALESNIFRHVLVSTDSEEIASVARKYGAEVPFLRDTKHDDHSTVSEATLSALVQAETHYKNSFDHVVQLLPTCPLRKSTTISQCFTNFLQKKHKSQISAFTYSWMNPWWARTMDKHGNPTIIFPEHHNKRSQDLETVYCPSGSIWIAQTNYLKKHKTFYGPEHKLYIIDWKEAVDIDSTDDMEIANALLSLTT